MKKYLIMFVCLFVFASGNAVLYAQESNEFLNAKIESMEKQLQDLKEQFLKQQEASQVEKQELLTLRKDLKGLVPGEGDYWAKKAFELQEKGLAPTFGKQYAKPFLRRFGRNTYVGGYIDHELVFDEGDDDFFDQHRLIPFIYSDVSDRVKFATEIEFEHGGTDSPGGVKGRSGEMKIEFATLDFLINDGLNYRGGIILSPLGKYNLVHDSPLQDLAMRPMIDRRIIPTTLSEAGMGFFGTFYPSELSKLDYEIYLVNGFQGLQDDGTQSTSSAENFIRSSRGSLKDDNNTNFAVVGRLAYSPFLGLEIAGSFHTGNIDERNRNRQTIMALDWTYQKGAFELVGEIAKTMTDRDGTVSTGQEVSDLVADDSFGYYIEPRYHFMPEFLQNIAPSFFNEFSTFTAVLRFGATDMGNFGYDSGKIRRTRITPGFNYRFTEDTVFKAEYLFNLEHGRELVESSNNQMVFSVSSYF
ncbi:MAG: hypothetical protein GY941_03730 [Planctomycetes bacterium]|nr:hypothetical protein [Planctomycetota bacterium]